jgi:FAD-linked sulfhydryl oxidase
MLALIIVIPLLVTQRSSSLSSGPGVFQEQHHSITKEDIFMSEMTNHTIKEELGRASWRLLHTMAAKFPVEPTHTQRTTLRTFLYTFAKMYPCGDCARHFTMLLIDHPPVVDSRSTITQWMCMIHNLVNVRLKKPEFDCALIKGIAFSRGLLFS